MSSKMYFFSIVVPLSSLDIIYHYLRCLYYLSLLFYCGGSLVAKSCPALATPWTVACQDPLPKGTLQARTLQWVAISFSRGSSQPKNWTQVSCITVRFFTNWTMREALAPYCFIFTHKSNVAFPYSYLLLSFSSHCVYIFGLWIYNHQASVGW